MAKLMKTYENNAEKYELTFMGKTYDYSMLKRSWGRTGNKPGFDTQVEKDCPELSDKILEALDAISFEDDSETLLKYVRSLSKHELLEGDNNEN